MDAPPTYRGLDFMEKGLGFMAGEYKAVMKLLLENTGLTNYL